MHWTVAHHTVVGVHSSTLWPAACFRTLTTTLTLTLILTLTLTLRPGELAPWEPGGQLVCRARAFAETRRAERGAATLSELLLGAPRSWMHI